MSTIEAQTREMLQAVSEAGDMAALESVRIAILGKKGALTELMKGLGAMSAEERKIMGPALNGAKDQLSAAIAARSQALHAQALDARLAQERIDVTLPARPEIRGAIHPVSQVIDEVIAIFGDMGFSVAEGPDIESDFYNFTALNIPPEHPA
ncbi:MAG: phenylalanine--tRNA ligase subunit alpha, partial [Alphaproteobacteria bacterium]